MSSAQGTELFVVVPCVRVCILPSARVSIVSEVLSDRSLTKKFHKQCVVKGGALINVWAFSSRLLLTFLHPGRWRIYSTAIDHCFCLL